MRVEITFNFRVVDGNAIEFFEAFPAPNAHQREGAFERRAVEPPFTPVLPLGTSTIVPGFSVLVG